MYLANLSRSARATFWHFPSFSFARRYLVLLFSCKFSFLFLSFSPYVLIFFLFFVLFFLLFLSFLRVGELHHWHLWRLEAERPPGSAGWPSGGRAASLTPLTPRGRKAPRFGWVTFGWASCIIDTFDDSRPKGPQVWLSDLRVGELHHWYFWHSCIALDLAVQIKL